VWPLSVAAEALGPRRALPPAFEHGVWLLMRCCAQLVAVCRDRRHRAGLPPYAPLDHPHPLVALAHLLAHWDGPASVVRDQGGGPRADEPPRAATVLSASLWVTPQARAAMR